MIGRKSEGRNMDPETAVEQQMVTDELSRH